VVGWALTNRTIKRSHQHILELLRQNSRLIKKNSFLSAPNTRNFKSFIWQIDRNWPIFGGLAQLVGLVQWGKLEHWWDWLGWCTYSKDCPERQAMVTDWEEWGIYWVPGVVPGNGVPGALGYREQWDYQLVAPRCWVKLLKPRDHAPRCRISIQHLPHHCNWCPGHLEPSFGWFRVAISLQSLSEPLARYRLLLDVSRFIMGCKW